MGIEGARVSREILAALGGIETRHDVRILLAVESGSRAWGFASADSDFDVRFIYCHRLEWYLRIGEQRDVIEETGPNLLDAGGWELRKALKLFARSNLALYEWINSPIVYREVAEFRDSLRQQIPSFFNPIAAVHHYLSMSRAAYETCAADGSITTKKLFYTLRALLACRWIDRNSCQPPTEFARLLDNVASAAEKSWVAGLLPRKLEGQEGDKLTLTSLQRETIAGELAHYSGYAARVSQPTKGSEQALDDILAGWVLASPLHTFKP
jgi:predicted nucleotidyltransferase